MLYTCMGAEDLHPSSPEIADQVLEVVSPATEWALTGGANLNEKMKIE